MPTSYWVVLVGWVLFTLSMGYAWYNLRKKIPVLINDFTKRENSLQNELIHYGILRLHLFGLISF